MMGALADDVNTPLAISELINFIRLLMMAIIKL
jgi:hypothetical protein